MNPAYLHNAQVDTNGIIAFVSDSAQMTTHFNVLRERGIDSRMERIDEAAPLYYVGINPVCKPLLIIYYENDMPCRPEQNILIYKSLLRFQAGTNIQLVELPGRHCNGSSRVDETGQFPYIREMVRFLKNV